MTKLFFSLGVFFLGVQSFAGFDTLVQPLGSCKITNSSVTALFNSERVTLDQQPYSKNLLVTFVDANGAPTQNPADDRSADRATIPASDEVKVKESGDRVQIIYRSSKLDNAKLELNKENGQGSLQRFLAFKGSIFNKKEIVQDFTLILNDCSIDTEALEKSVEPQ